MVSLRNFSVRILKFWIILDLQRSGSPFSHSILVGPKLKDLVLPDQLNNALRDTFAAGCGRCSREAAPNLDRF